MSDGEKEKKHETDYECGDCRRFVYAADDV